MDVVLEAAAGLAQMLSVTNAGFAFFRIVNQRHFRCCYCQQVLKRVFGSNADLLVRCPGAYRLPALEGLGC